MAGKRVAVITGASSGIGEAIARELARSGWHCVLLARRAEELERIAAEIGGEWEVCDVSDRAQVDEVAARVLERHPSIGLLVNNAGVPARGSFLDIEPELIERVIAVNYLGSVWCLRAFAPGPHERPAHVVNLVSVAGTVAFAPAGAYAASKHAQLAFSRSTAALLRPSGIQVHTVMPGFVETEGFPQRAKLRSPLLRRFVIEADDVAHAVVKAVERAGARSRCRGSRTASRDRAGSRARRLLAARHAPRRAAPRRVGLRAGLPGDVPADLDLVGRRGCGAADPHALVLVEPGELEPLFEVDALARHLGDEEHEVVRVEEAADVRLGEKPLVRRVAQALEAIHLEAQERVDRAELVGDEDLPAGRATRASSETASSGRRT